MSFGELELALLDALEPSRQDFKRAQELISLGADVNAVDHSGKSILEECIGKFGQSVWGADGITEISCCEYKKTEDRPLVRTVEFLLNAGLNIARSGWDCIFSLVYSTYDEQIIDAAKLILRYDLKTDDENADEALEAAATEESYQRCCEKNRPLENLYFALVEIIDAKRQGRPFGGIDPYFRALGMRIDRVVSFSETDTMCITPRGTEYTADLGLVSEDRVLVISTTNILLMNDRRGEKPQIDVSAYFEDCIGARIADVSFTQREVVPGYTQVTVILSLDNGKQLCITDNFGELPDNMAQTRFYIRENASFSG